MPTCLLTTRSGEDVLPARRPPPLLRPTVSLHEVQPDPLAGLLPGVLDLLSDGLVVADASARVLYMNRSAEMMMARGSLSIRGGLLCAGVCSDTQALQACIAGCTRRGEGSAHLKTSARLFVTITAFESMAGHPGTRPAAVILLRDADRTAGPSPQSIIAYFGLTPAEARLANEITKGDGLVRCARRLGTRVTTVRSHLKHIFEKTETKRQAHLVRLLLTCGSSLAPAGRDHPGSEAGRDRAEARR